MTPARWGLVVLVVLVFAFARRRGGRRVALALAAIGALGAGVYRASLEPRAERPWRPEQARQAWAEIDGERVRLHDVRGFRWRGETDFDEHWFTADYDAAELVGVDFLIARISSFTGVAHTMVSFRFRGAGSADERFLVLSVEARKETGESYGVVAGCMKQYELMYVLGDERDLVELRAAHIGNDIHLYPVVASHEALTRFFLDVCERATELCAHPEFYDTLAQNCTTALVRHWERAAKRELGFDYRVLFPGYSAELAQELGLLGSDELDALRARGAISARARAAAGREDFSQRLRGE